MGHGNAVAFSRPGYNPDSMVPDRKQLQEILDFAVAAARAAGAITLGHFASDAPYELKADNTPVTRADREAEECLRARIEKSFPTHGILGEEFGEKTGSEPARWILDPIDGTVSFISGVPFYSVLVGLEWGGEMLAGVIHLPALRETVYAARGLGCWCDGRPARVSDVAEISQAHVSTTSMNTHAKLGRAAAYSRLRGACRLDRGWADAYAFALLATGRIDVAVEPIMSIWDNAAPAAVVTEAGGTFTDWSGNPTHTAPEALATNGKLLGPVVQRLRG